MFLGEFKTEQKRGDGMYTCYGVHYQIIIKNV